MKEYASGDPIAPFLVYWFPEQGISVTSPELSFLILMVDESHNVPDTRNDRPRPHDHRRHPQVREQVPRPAEKAEEGKEVGLDDDETEQDRASSPPRQRRGGRPEKKVYEEWASDPYCE